MSNFKEPVDGATRVRVALPKYILRGVSGSTFGKTFALHGTMVVGRAAECEISIPTEEVSRRHAQLRTVSDGIHVEDLGSANGTFINGERVKQGVLMPGDELRLDTVRFTLIVPGQELQQAAQKTSAPSAISVAAQQEGSSLGLYVAIGVAAVLLFGVVLWSMGVF